MLKKALFNNAMDMFSKTKFYYNAYRYKKVSLFVYVKLLIAGNLKYHQINCFKYW